MKREDELVLKITKEVVVKLIEVGRLSVGSFDEVWQNVHQSVSLSLKENKTED